MKHASDSIPLRSSTWKLIFFAGLFIFVFAVASAQTPSASNTAPMTQEASELLKKALTVSTEERAQLVDSLLESLEERHEDSAAVEAAWNDEIARRIAELESGKAKTIPWEEVRQRISAKLTNGR